MQQVKAFELKVGDVVFFPRIGHPYRVTTVVNRGRWRVDMTFVHLCSHSPHPSSCTVDYYPNSKVAVWDEEDITKHNAEVV